MSEDRELTGLDLANAEVKRLAEAHTASLAALDAEIAEAEKEAQEMTLPSIRMPLKHRLAGLRRAREIIAGGKP